MIDTPFFDLSATRIADLVRTGAASATEMAEASLSQIDRLDGDIHAFLQVTPEIARAKAASIDDAIADGVAPGVLAGVPVAFKDNMHQMGTRMTCSSKMLEDYECTFDATCVADTLAAGAIGIGKLNLDEFAFGSSTETSAFGRTMNPWDLARVPGGSSGGSAAAVAAGMVPIALGSDTGGSIRQPASLCGVVGLKPTYGMVSRYGVVAFGSSLDQVGPLARCVGDVALAMDALAKYDHRDSTSQRSYTSFTEALDAGVEGRTIGIVPAMIEAEGVSAEVREATHLAAKHLESLGANIVEIELPHSEHAMGAYYIVGPGEAASNLARFDSIRYGYADTGAPTMSDRYDRSRRSGFGPEVIRRIMLGTYLLSAGVYDEYYVPAQKVRTLIIDDYHAAFEQVDAILTPTAPRTAFVAGEIVDPTSMYLSDMFTVSVNIAGNCGISVPVGLGSETGLPVGVQLVGNHFDDVRLLQVARALESAYAIDRVAPMARG